MSVCFKEPLQTELLLKTVKEIHWKIQKTPPGPGFQPGKTLTKTSQISADSSTLIYLM